MTVYEDEVEVKRPGVGTKVLVLACAILAVLGSFWGIVWFIRAYVEPPRVMAPAPLLLASRENRPAPAPTPAVAVKSTEPQAAPAVIEAQTAAPAPAATDRSAAGAVADRWAPMNQFAPPPAAMQAAPPPSAASTPTDSAPASLTTTALDADEVAEGSIPAIDGPIPLPRRKPVMTAARRNEAPLPRPRPEAAGSSDQSVWTAVPSADERFRQ